MNTALVIVDMLQDFVDGRLANPAAVPTIEPIGALAEAARGRKDWIVVYGNDHQPGDLSCVWPVAPTTAAVASGPRRRSCGGAGSPLRERRRCW